MNISINKLLNQTSKLEELNINKLNYINKSIDDQSKYIIELIESNKTNLIKLSSDSLLLDSKEQDSLK